MPRGTTMGEIEAKYETLLGEFTPDAVFIDYLQLMKPTVGQKGQDWLDVGHAERRRCLVAAPQKSKKDKAQVALTMPSDGCKANAEVVVEVADNGEE